MVLYVVLVLAIEAFLLFRLLTSLHLICLSFFVFQSMSKVVHPHWYQYISIYICNVTFVLQYDSDQNQNLPWYQWSFHFTTWYNTSHKYIDAIANPITIFVLFILANFYKNQIQIFGWYLMFVETYMPRPYYHTKFLILGRQWYILNKIWTISLWSPCHPYGQYVVAIKSKFSSFVI